MDSDRFKGYVAPPNKPPLDDSFHPRSRAVALSKLDYAIFIT